MICKFNHEGDCCNCGSVQYMAKCKPEKCDCSVPMTNYDRIKSMSVDEMAVYLVEEHEYGVAHETYFVCPDGMEYDEDKYQEAIEYTKQWLLQEVSDE